MMGTVIEKPHGYRLHTKGASEIVLDRCESYLDVSGNHVALDQNKRDYLVKNVIEEMACNGLRTICVAYRDFERSEKVDWSWENEVMSQLTCLCLVGIEDPVRDEVPGAIKKCQTSGVVVR